MVMTKPNTNKIILTTYANINKTYPKNLMYTCQILLNFEGNRKEKPKEALEITQNALKTLARSKIGNQFNMLLENIAENFTPKITALACHRYVIRSHQQNCHASK